jgi:hypothetical protein
MAAAHDRAASSTASRLIDVKPATLRPFLQDQK